MRAPVLRVWMKWSVFSAGGLPSASMSAAWPPTMPNHPAASATSWMTWSSVSGLTIPRGVLPAMIRKASVSRASPARIATASPNTLWLVGLPRRVSSSSMAGRSSWMRE